MSVGERNKRDGRKQDDEGRRDGGRDGGRAVAVVVGKVVVVFPSCSLSSQLILVYGPSLSYTTNNFFSLPLEKTVVKYQHTRIYNVYIKLHFVRVSTESG